jgi:3D-(3,5/4)-trihydroxycyclohexane-1,2-dione acylhydrolase (decyclizing)
MVSDGSYMMLNGKLLTSVMLGKELIVRVLDNRGYGCINRLQAACGGAAFNNLIRDVDHVVGESWIDFAGRARALGALAEKVTGIGDLKLALERANAANRTYFVAIDTDPCRPPRKVGHGGTWPCRRCRRDPRSNLPR